MIVCSFCSRRNSLPMVKFVRICKIHFFFFLWIFKHPFPVWMLHPGYMPQIKSARFRDDEMRSKSCRLGSFCSNLRIPGVCGKNRMCFLFIYCASSMQLENFQFSVEFYLCQIEEYEFLRLKRLLEVFLNHFWFSGHLASLRVFCFEPNVVHRTPCRSSWCWGKSTVCGESNMFCNFAHITTTFQVQPTMGEPGCPSTCELRKFGCVVAPNTFHLQLPQQHFGWYPRTNLLILFKFFFCYHSLLPCSCGYQICLFLVPTTFSFWKFEVEFFFPTA